MDFEAPPIPGHFITQDLRIQNNGIAALQPFTSQENKLNEGRFKKIVGKILHLVRKDKRNNDLNKIPNFHDAQFVQILLFILGPPQKPT